MSPLFIQNAGKDEKRNGTVTDQEDDGNDLADRADDRQSPVVVPAHGLEKALDAMLEMEKQHDHGRHVDARQ